QPKEDGDPRFATEAKVAYDDRNLYVFIRAFDPHPDSILKLLARRDVRAATRVDSLGWTAEFRIPLSQLRYVPRAKNTFGFAVWRDIQRYSERVSWPVYRGSQAGISSQLGELTGLDGLPSPRRPEIAPYVVSKNVSVPVGSSSFD